MAVVFCNTREGAHELAGRLQEETDLVVDEIHGNMSQGQRNQVIREFEKARTQVLVASDIAARGLDVEGITHVFNYDIPRQSGILYSSDWPYRQSGNTRGSPITYATPEDILLLRKTGKRQSRKIITKYDEKREYPTDQRPVREEKRLSCPVCTNRQRKRNIRCLDIKGLT